MNRRVMTGLAALVLSGWVQANEFHPEFPMLDGNGDEAALSGQPMSAMQTCGACHDTAFIRQSSDHAVEGVVNGDDMNCLVCHSDGASPTSESLVIRKPRDENCGVCHGLVSNELDEPLTIPEDHHKRAMTSRTGEVISPQKVANSGMNISGKLERAHAFDVHADRLVGCVNCHYSLNNPVYFQQRAESLPPHLDFDPRRLTSAEYLERPLHQLAKGGGETSAMGGSAGMRRCEGCHDAGRVHNWLPYKQRHFEALACEACHVPALFGPAVQAEDMTLVDSEGHPLRQYRSIEGDPSSADSLVHGYQPVLLPRATASGDRRLAPFNLESRWFWVAGEGAEPVSAQSLQAALYPDGSLHPALLVLLDENGDGLVENGEFRLDDESEQDAVRKLLQEHGLGDVRLASAITPHPVSHNVVNGRWATRECRSCHGADSSLAASFALSDYLPAGLMPDLNGAGDVTLSGSIGRTAAGGAAFVPDTAAAGFYIIGLDGLTWIDRLGLAMFLGVAFGVTIHGVARHVANRRRPRPSYPSRRVYMYDAYERLWHWLQAGAILLLIFTGLIIHKPHFFGVFSFAYVVQVHNVLGFILLINAALALFYTLASGTIKRFLPAPRGFFGRAIAQAMFYSRGIFAGAPHPLQKTREDRLNPLQQITYLAILNILLPAQVITGVLIWGMQEWPQLAARFGGLPVLAPIHTILAWAFSAFIVMHVYLTTAAGKTAGAGIRSMVTGWEDVEEHGKESVNG